MKLTFWAGYQTMYTVFSVYHKVKCRPWFPREERGWLTPAQLRTRSRQRWGSLWGSRGGRDTSHLPEDP